MHSGYGRAGAPQAGRSAPGVDAAGQLAVPEAAPLCSGQGAAATPAAAGRAPHGPGALPARAQLQLGAGAAPRSKQPPFTAHVKPNSDLKTCLLAGQSECPTENDEVGTAALIHQYE